MSSECLVSLKPLLSVSDSTRLDTTGDDTDVFLDDTDETFIYLEDGEYMHQNGF